MLYGFLEHEKGRSMPLFDVLKNTKLLLFTDHEAGFGLIVAEAMNAGLPVVAYNLPIFGEVYKQGYVSVPLGNTEKFASEILSFLNDPKRYETLKSLAKRQAEAFDWNQAARKFERLVHTLTPAN